MHSSKTNSIAIHNMGAHLGLEKKKRKERENHLKIRIEIILLGRM